MKNLGIIFAVAFGSIVLFSSCKEECVTCTEKDSSGAVVSTSETCSEDDEVLDAFEASFKSVAAFNGNTAECK